MINGDEGGQLSDFIGGDTVLMRGDIRLIGGDPPPSPPPLGKTLSCLIFIKGIVYFENKFVLSLQTSYADYASFKITIFSFAWKSKHLEWNSPLISLSLHLRGRVVTKGRNIKDFVKSRPLFDVQWQCVQTFLIDLQAEVSRFRCRIFHCFVYFLKL